MLAMIVTVWVLIGLLLCVAIEREKPDEYGWGIHLEVVVLWPIFLIALLWRK